MRRHTKEELEFYKNNGKKRASIERNFLLFLFNGFSQITLDGKNYAEVLMINNECLLAEYTHLIKADVDNDYVSLASEGKEYFHIITSLDSLVDRGLLEKKSWFINDFSPEDGVVNLTGKLQGSEANRVGWISRALLSTDRKSRRCVFDQYSQESNQHRPDTFEFHSLQYEFTEKGYDVALTIEEHRRQQSRYEEQAQLHAKAVEAASTSAKAAESSRRIAQWAVIAAYLIGISSLGNLIFHLFK